jgi:hypothetical protein
MVVMQTDITTQSKLYSRDTLPSPAVIRCFEMIIFFVFFFLSSFYILKYIGFTKGNLIHLSIERDGVRSCLNINSSLFNVFRF